MLYFVQMVGGRAQYGLPVHLYHWILGSLGLLFLIYYSFDSPFPAEPVPPLIFSIFLIMHVIASFLHFQYARMNVVITFGSSFITATFLVFGALPAVYVAVTGILIGSVKRWIERRFLLKKNIPNGYEIGVILFNTGMVALMWLSASWLYFRVFPSQFPLIHPTAANILSIFGVFIAVGLLNAGFVFFSVFLRQQHSLDYLKKAVLPAFFAEFAAIPFGIVMALAYNRLGIPAFVMLASTLLLANVALRRLNHIRDDLEAKLRHLTTLNRVSKRIITIREEEAAMNLLLEELGSVVETDRWFVASVDQWKQLHLLHAKERAPFAMMHLASEVAQSGHALLFSNAMREPSPADRELLLRDEIRSCMVVPLIVADKIHMILGVYSNEISAFKKEHLQVLVMVADETALAIENAKLYQALTEKVEQLESLNNQLLQLDRLKSEFLSNVSHELRTPLTSIKGYVEYIKKEKLGPITELQKEGLGIAQRNILRLQRMINDLLDYTKLEFKKAPIELRPCRLENIWAEVYEQYAEVIEKRNLAVQVEFAGDLPVLLVDIQRFTHVLRNLLSNAIKFSNDQGRIVIRAQAIHHPGPYFNVETYTSNCLVEALTPIEITITDEGIGIPAEALPRIFDRFYQVDSSHTRKYGGTGLGLAFVKTILDAHGIPIDVQSRPGLGTTFGMVVPSLNAADLSAAVKPEKPETISTPKYLT